jgi:hypothetical protein
MFQRIIVILVSSLLLSSCGGGAPASTEAPAIAELLATEAPAATEEPVDLFQVEATPTAELTQPLAPEATATPAITQTETLLPPLELPTEIVNAPARMAWDGVPTYLGDSTPGFSFRVTFDPDVWAVTADQFGYPALGHRNIEYCVIAVTAGRGFPANVTVEYDVLYSGSLTFDVGSAYENGIKKFTTFTAGDGRILTSFEVSFQENVDACLNAAVTVLTTLTSVSVAQATPPP